MLFEAYKVAVRVSMIDKVSPALAGISRQFAKTGGDIDLIQKKLDRIKLMGMGGAAMAGVGFMGLGVIGKMVKPAEEYAHQLNVINMAGWKQAEIVKAQAASWKTTNQVITTSVTDNIANLLDLKNVLGTLPEAIHALPLVSKIQAVLAASADRNVGSNAKSLAYEVAKSVDMIGGAKDYGTYKREADMMAKVIIATGGRVTPGMYRQVFLYGRQASAGWSDKFKYQLLPTLMQEASSSHGGGGGSKGIGPATAAFFRTVVQGYINKKQLPMLEQLGLLKHGSALNTTTSGTTTGPMKNYQLAISNPYQWTQKVLMPAIHAKYGDVSRQQLTMILGQIFRGNQSAAWLVGQFATKPFNFERDAANIRQTMSVDKAYKFALSHDPNTAEKALGAQWTNFKTAFTMSVVPVLVPALMKLTHAFNDLADWARKNQSTAKYITYGLIGLFAAMAAGGTIIATIAAVRAMMLAVNLLGVAPVLGLTKMFGSMLPMIKLIGPAAGAFGAAAFGLQQMYKAVTTGTSDVYNWVSKFGQMISGDKNWNLGGAIFDLVQKISHLIDRIFGPEKHPANQFPKMGGAHSQLYHWQHPASAADVQKALQVDVHVDGKKVARAVFDHAGNAASGPMSGTSVMNGASLLPPPNFVGGH